MCTACLLLDNSIPTPKALLSAKNEYNLDDNHFTELFNKTLDKVPEEDQGEYFEELLQEFYLDYINGEV